jgi:ferredoxin
MVALRGAKVAEDEVARDAATITEVLDAFEADGYAGQFKVLDGGRVQCLTCRHEVDARTVELERLCRLEGASDPADMLAVGALRCPNCHTRGTVVLNYGPESTLEDADVLLALDDERKRA